jgi:hypothetical protein
MVVARLIKKGDFIMFNNRNANTSHKPAYVAYQVREIGEDKSFWTRIGSAWKHSDGEGVNIQLDAIPLDGRITLRIATEAKD